jgi:hypothetical protein
MRYAVNVRTTLDIDEDVLCAAKDIAAQRNQSAGKAVSDLLRLALRQTSHAPTRNGIRLIERPADAPRTTLAQVNRLRDES